PASSTADNGASQGRNQPLTRQPDTGSGKEGIKGGGSMPGANFLSVILTYFGIMGVFAAITYYADKWIARGRKRLRLSRP
ncbi:MAG: hypothetical protein K0Q90_1672, partial [Paenibacillaceae bacterium]|nr:hypothetical protein [Paenibacillaceae bacterium]